MKYIYERLHEYDANYFINDLFELSKALGIYEAMINNYQFKSILIPLLHKKEAVSSMYIEGTQTTISDVFENEISQAKNDDKIIIEVNNHTRALSFGAEYLLSDKFSHQFIKKLHEIMLTGIIAENKKDTLGKYKESDNYIVNSLGKVVFTPPSHKETQKYMDELLNFMNKTDDEINPLIKAAIIHAQFESIHPFDDGNGRVGRLLVGLYLFKTKVINVPFFYISEAISQDKTVYYNRLTDTRSNNYNEWIKFFLRKCILQATNHIKYVQELNLLYDKTKNSVKKSINTPRFDVLVEALFTQPIITSAYLAEHLQTSIVQAKRYLKILEENKILVSNDKQRYTAYYFMELLELVRRN